MGGPRTPAPDLGNTPLSDPHVLAMRSYSWDAQYPSTHPGPSPICRPLCVQQLEDGFPVHIRGDVQSCDVQDGGGQVNVEDNVGIPEGGMESRTQLPGQ